MLQIVNGVGAFVSSFAKRWKPILLSKPTQDLLCVYTNQ